MSVMRTPKKPTWLKISRAATTSLLRVSDRAG
jgi:hypothetical protein